jgi:hypothetical protein
MATRLNDAFLGAPIPERRKRHAAAKPWKNAYEVVNQLAHAIVRNHLFSGRKAPKPD